MELSNTILKNNRPKVSQNGAKSPHYGTVDDPPFTTEPHCWFVAMFPQSWQLYGPGFFDQRQDGEAPSTARHRPLESINVNAWAHALGGDSRIGTKLVYYKEEDLFYFYDYAVDALRITTEARIKILLSWYLQRCATACLRDIDTTKLLEDFQSEAFLNRIISKAKILLAVEASFFERDKGPSRYNDDENAPSADGESRDLFFQNMIFSKTDGNLTLQRAFERFLAFCKENGFPPLKRPVFKDRMVDLIKTEHGLGFRHDIPDQEGNDEHGWKGVDCLHQTVKLEKVISEKTACRAAVLAEAAAVAETVVKARAADQGLGRESNPWLPGVL